jgi:hypothetical protein
MILQDTAFLHTLKQFCQDGIVAHVVLVLMRAFYVFPS